MNLKLPKLKLKINPKRISIFVLLLMMISAGFFYFLKVREAGASWWDSDWFFRRSITFNSSQISADLTNFPVLVSFTDQNLINHAQPDGDDFVFVETNGNRLDHEIEKYSSSTGELVAWVKIPFLDADNDFDIYMYYGNDSVGNQQKPEAVWDDNYVGVWHHQTSSTEDSTKFNNNGTAYGHASTTINGKIGGAYSFDGDNDYIKVPSNDSLNQLQNITVCAWVNPDSLPSQYPNIVSKQTTDYDSGWDLYLRASENSGFGTSYSNNGEYSYAEIRSSLVTNGSWHYICGTQNGNGGANMNIYYNGAVQVAIRNAGNIRKDDSANDLFFGIQDGNLSDFDGNLDEIKISKIVRSADWIQTEYNNQNSPSTFISLGPEERSPSPALYLPFDEGFGTTAHDESSNRNDGTIVGATWKDESECKSGKCLEFDGNGDYVEVADTSSLDLDNEFTLEAWIKPQSTTLNNQTILSKVETPNEPTKIFRSVAPGATTALAVGTTNSMSIVGERAIFQTALPDNVGVGDAIQYDDDNDSDIDVNDSIVFIKSRVSNVEYLVATASGTVPIQVNNDNNWSLFRAYSSLSNAEKGVENTGIDSDLRNFDDWTAGGDATTDDVGEDLVAANQQWNIACYANGTTADSTATAVNGWTTEVNNYIKIYTPVDSNEVGVTQRHSGKWDDNKYNHKIISDWNAGINVINSYTVLSGLQVSITGLSSSGLVFTGNKSLVENSIVANCTGAGIYLDSEFGTKVLNNIVYNNDTGIIKDADGQGGALIYNNTVVNNIADGIRVGAWRVITVKNNYAGNNGVDLTQESNATMVLYSTYTSDGSLATPQIAYATTSGAFFSSIASGTEDFHLQPSSQLKNIGTDLSSDNTFPIATDIDGQSRLINSDNTKFDIGADEAQATKIFRSVAPGKTDALENGEENSLSIVGNSATFQRALADNVGVGDVIQYDDDNDGDIDANDSLAFIAERISGFEYIVTTASGGVPIPVIGDNDWSLFRAYTSLSNSESGRENTGINNDLRNFDDWTAGGNAASDDTGKDLVAANQQWNIICYANGTTSESAGTSVDGWTTGVQNYIKISASENDMAQLSGWDPNKYNISNAGPIGIVESYVRLIGLQIEIVGDTFNRLGVTISGNSDDSDVRIEGCRIRGTNFSTGAMAGIYFDSSSYAVKIMIANNIIENLLGSSGRGIQINQSPHVKIYNNIIHNVSGQGIVQYVGTPIIDIKNTVVFDTPDDFGGLTYMTVDHCASNDGDGTNAVTPADWNNVFMDYANGDFRLKPTGTDLRNAGVDLSTTNYALYDMEGDERNASSSAWDIGPDESTATKIFRSVGPGNTTALATDNNHENTLSVTDGVATFEESLPNRIGVGDAVLIDTNSDNAITSADTLLFIHGRNSFNSYDLRTHTGAIPGDIGSNDTYQIYRAYTSLANAEAGIENTAIAVTTFNGGDRNLVNNNEEWNIACYGDAVETEDLSLNGWDTSTENYIRFFTPVNKNQVGINQRHDGRWGNGFRTEGEFRVYQVYNIKLEGLSLRRQSGSDYSYVFYGINSSSAEIELKDCFGWAMLGSEVNGSQVFKVFSSNATTPPVFKFFNNIFINDSAEGYSLMAHSDSVVKMYLYNNTFISSFMGVSTSASTAYIKNNIVQAVNDGYSGTFDSSSGFNISNLASDAPGANSKNSTTVSFRDEANNDYHLAMTDTSAKGAGLNLSYDLNLRVTSDTEGEQRPLLRSSSYGEARPSNDGKFDIGADQISNTTHNNYSLNINSNYPSATYSTSQRDNESFSSGDINLEANTWSHIVYKRNADTEELYINGAKKDSNAITDFVKTNNGKLYIGAENPNSKNSFKGLLDEIRIYNYSRSDDEIKKDTTQGSSGKAASRASEGVSVAIGDKASSISDGLVGYWKMDESSWNGTSQEVKDASGNNNHGVASGGASTTAGKFGNGGAFDGDNDHIDYSQKISATYSSVCSWFYYKNNGQGQGLFSDDGNDANLDSYVNELGFVYLWADNINNTRTRLMDDTTLIDDEWNHVCLLFGESGRQIYVNGELGVGDSDVSKKINYTTVGEVEGYNFNGKIDETRIYNRSISPDEVKKLYEYAPGPVMHLKMDEKVKGDNQSLFDSSGNGNTATTSDKNGNVLDCTVLGKRGAACEIAKNSTFDNPDDDEITRNSFRVGESTSFTVGLWVKTNIRDSDTLGGIVTSVPYSAWGMTSSGWAISVGGSGGTYRLNVYAGDGTSGSQKIVENDLFNDYDWHYITFVFDRSGGYAHTYIDGIEDADGSWDISGYGDVSGSIFNIGRYYTRLNGFVDDLRIYNYARTQEQILEDMRGSSGVTLGGGAGALGAPILDLNFNEGQGNTAYDASGNGNHGTLIASTSGVNLTTTAMWDKGGKKGGAIEFDGDDYVRVASNIDIANKSFTISTWAKRNGSGEEDYIVGQGWVSNSTGLHFGFRATNQFTCAFTSNDLNADPSYSDLNWHQWICTYDADSNMRTIYRDGEMVANGIAAADYQGSGVLNIGARYSSAIGNFNGKIDEVKIYNYALNEEAVKTLYNNSSSMVMGGDETRNNNGTAVTGANKDYCVPGDTAKCDKPVGEWKFDEKSGTTAFDSSGNGKNGSIVGPTWTSGKVGSGLNFVPTAEIKNIPDLGIQGDFSISGWIKPNTLSGEHTIYYPGGFYVQQDGDKLEWKRDTVGCLQDGSGSPIDNIISGSILNLGKWQYVNFVSDATNNKIYIYHNGKVILSQSGKSDCLVVTANYIGSCTARFFDGAIDEVKVYNYARTPAQIAWDYNRGKPVLEWSFNEGSGVTAHNEIENINHGTISGATWKNESECKYGKCLSFNGVNNYVGFSSTGADNYPISFSVWVKPNTLAQNGIVLSFDGTNVNQSFGIYNDTDKILISNDNYGLNGIGNYLTAQRWQLWTLVFEDASTYSFYLDGTEIPLVDVTDRYDVNGNNIGARANGTQRQFNGSIDEVKIFNYALTEEQIKIDYNGGAVNFR